MENLLHRYRGHAAVIDGAMPQFARAAIGHAGQQFYARTERPRALLVGRSENSQSWHTQRGHYVHGACVIGHIKVAALHQSDKFIQ